MTSLMIQLALPTWDYDSYWGVVIQIAIVCAILLFANTLRRKIKIFQTLLIPTPIIGGFLGLGLKYLLTGLGANIGGSPLITSELMATITYHTIAIGFIAMGLKGSDKPEELGNTTIKQVNSMKSGLFIVGNYLLQGVVGLLITIPLSYVFSDIASYSGILLPMGYGQGPGQANNIGLIFEGAGFAGGQSFGLTIATMGYIAASIGGVIALNALARKGIIKKTKRLDSDKPTIHTVVEGSDEIPLVESVDKLTIQIAMVGLIYLISWGVMAGLATLFALSDTPENIGFLTKTVTPLLFGFNFIIASLVTILVKVIIKRLKKSNIMHRTYTNDFLLNRIGGLAFDFMIISSIMAIDIESISSTGMIVTLLILGVVGGFITYFYDIYITRRVYKDYPDAAFLAFYGTMTGTTSTGIAVLRELDPNFETPAASDLVVGSTTAIMFGFPLLLIVGVIFKSTGWLYGSLGIMTFMFFVFNYFLLKKPSLKSKKK